MSRTDRIITTIIWFLAICAIAAGLFWCMATGNAKLDDQPPKTTTTTEKIQEDDPRWDCHEMGNRICGPGKG